MKKGSSILVEGRMQTRSWDDKDGKKNYRTEIVADNIQFGSRGGGGSSASSASASGASAKGDKGAADATGQPEDKSGEAIEYPKDDINPDDIPF